MRLASRPYNAAMKTASSLLAALLLASFLGCGTEASLVGTYHIEQDGYGFGPGAEKIATARRRISRAAASPTRWR